MQAELTSMIDDNALWILASAIHDNVPLSERPMSWSDFSPEQIDRLRRAAMKFVAALPPAHWREIEIFRLIELLRSEEGDCVTIFCDNPDFNMGANNAVECNGFWTNWEHRRFEGESLLDALSAAMIEYKRPRTEEAAKP